MVSPLLSCNTRWRCLPSCYLAMRWWNQLDYYTAAFCCIVYSKLALALLVVPVQLRQRTKIHTSKTFGSFCYSNTTRFGQTDHHQTSWGGNCFPVVTLLHFAFQRCKIRIKYFVIIFRISCHDHFVVCTCCETGVSVIHNNITRTPDDGQLGRNI
jgi:hypothetical protein